MQKGGEHEFLIKGAHNFTFLFVSSLEEIIARCFIIYEILRFKYEYKRLTFLQHL